MIFPDNIEQKLGFDKIRFLITEQCLSDEGRNWVTQMKWSTSYEQISLWLLQTKEAMNILKSDYYIIEVRLPNIEKAIARLKIEGALLTLQELYELRVHTLQFEKIYKYLVKHKEVYPNLSAIAGNAESENRILSIIDRVIDEKGQLKPNASPQLATLIGNIAKAERDVNKKISSLYTKYQSLGVLAETEITIKDGRPVLPVLSEHKRKVKGYVHDESGAGKILYIEPEELIELNNLHTELELEKKREIEKILRKATKELSVYIAIIREHFRLLGVLDFIQAKAIFGLKINAAIPQLSKEKKVELIQARHPLLFLNLIKQQQEIVHQDIFLNQEKRLMVISGPNGGGKSVTLKTIGLAQYMVQNGLPVAAASNSFCGVFDHLFLDIGDDQSLENNLSSYTSHLMAMKMICEHTEENSLVLIDELGTGTDPTFGGPMAEAFLNEINQKQSFGVITTHFSNLKKVADLQEGMFNASMGYDTELLQPLYNLIANKPGSSYAFEAAQKVGIPAKVINYAKKVTDARILKLDSLLADAEKERNQYNELLKTVKKKEELAQKLIDEYQMLKQSMVENKKAMMDMAREKALTIVEDANREVEKTIKSIIQEKANKEKTKQIRSKLNDRKEGLKKELGLPVFNKLENEKTSKNLNLGDLVRIKGSQMLAELVELKGENATLMIGNIKTRVKTSELEIAQTDEKRIKAINKRGVDLIEKQKEFRSEIDVRGFRGEESLKFVEQWLDEAHVLGFSKLRIIHGKGDGILKKLIRDYLRRQSIVLNIASEHADLGGDGVSLVEIR